MLTRRAVGRPTELTPNSYSPRMTFGWGPRAPGGLNGPTDFEIVPNTSHTSLVKPEFVDHLSVKIARAMLLATDKRPPWAAEPDPRQPDLRRKQFEQQTHRDREQNRFVYRISAHTLHWPRPRRTVARRLPWSSANAFSMAPNQRPWWHREEQIGPRVGPRPGQRVVERRFSRP